MTDTTLHQLCKGFGALLSRSKDPSFPEEAARLNERGNLPLHAACSFQATADVVEVLLKAYPGGASQPNSAGNLPIHQAAMWQAPLETVQLLLSKYPEGATVRNQYGSLPLHMAASNQASLEIVRLLIDSYPDALHLQNDDGMTPLDLALADESTVSDAILALLEGRPPPPELTRRQQAERYEERAMALERKLATLRDSGGRQDNDLRLTLAAVRKLADRFPHALYAAKMDPNELEIAFSTAGVGGANSPTMASNNNEFTAAEAILLEAVKKRGEVPPRDRVEDLLSSIVGLEHIKSQVRGLRRTAEISDLKESLLPPSIMASSYGGVGRGGGALPHHPQQKFLQLISPALVEDLGRPAAPHMVFCGSPGTGKTAVARLLAKAFHELGLLRKPKFLEVERMDLVAREPEATIRKTREVLDEARGGILLIDEAYSLAVASKRKSGVDTGIDAIAEIIRGIDHSAASRTSTATAAAKSSSNSNMDDFPLIILAGFPLDMRAFLAFQPELRKRFPLVLEFPDYTCQELAKIFVDLATAKGFDLDESLTPSHIAQLLEQETTPAWRGERNGRVTEMLLAGVRTEVRKRMRKAQLEEQDDFDPHLIVREDVENVMRNEFK